MRNRRVVLVGLDCLEPSLAFGKFASQMPFLNGQKAKFSGGVLDSCTPPITVPAWASMLTGKDPGELGVYGFRNRNVGHYDLHTVDGNDISVPWIWDEMQQQHNKKAAALFVPGMSPLRQSDALQVACFLHKPGDTWRVGAASDSAVLQAIEKSGTFSPDVPMTENLDDFADGLFASGKYRFDVLQRVIAENQHEFVCFVDLGADRLHHQCFDEGTKLSGSPAAQLLSDYYGFLDAQLQRLAKLAASQPRETVFLVASDHGAQPITSAFFVNAWLEKHGFLVMRPGNSDGPLRVSEVDFGKTQAWAEGGYYGRIMLNLAGREPQGIVAPSDAEHVLAQIRIALEKEGIVAGHTLQVRSAAELYREVRGLPPDLFLSIDGYAGRVLSSFRGSPRKLWGDYGDVLQEPGRHGCNHALHGLAVAYSTSPEAELVAPTQLEDVHRWLTREMVGS